MSFSAINYALDKKYVEDTAEALGAVKGAPCTIKSIEKKNDQNIITFEWVGKSGQVETEQMFVNDGTPIYVWEPKHDYKYGDLVIHASCFYRCITPNADEVFDDTKWNEIGSPDGNYDIVKSEDLLPARFTSADRKVYYVSNDKCFRFWNGYKWIHAEREELDKFVEVDGIITYDNNVIVYATDLEDYYKKEDGYGLYPDEDKEKLADIEEEAEKNKIVSLTVNGEATVIDDNRNVDITIPDAPVQSISVDGETIEPDANGNVEIALQDRFDEKVDKVEDYSLIHKDDLEQIGLNKEAIELLNSDDKTEGSVDYKIKEVIEGLDLETELDKKVDKEENYSLVHIDDIEQIGLNKDAIEVLNGTGEGSVAKSIADAIAATTHLTCQVVEEVPSVEDAKPNVIYLKETEDKSVYETYMLVINAEGEREVKQLGNTKVDLTDYVTKENLYDALFHTIPVEVIDVPENYVMSDESDPDAILVNEDNIIEISNFIPDINLGDYVKHIEKQSHTEDVEVTIYMPRDEIDGIYVKFEDLGLLTDKDIEEMWEITESEIIALKALINDASISKEKLWSSYKTNTEIGNVASEMRGNYYNKAEVEALVSTGGKSEKEYIDEQLKKYYTKDEVDKMIFDLRNKLLVLDNDTSYEPLS